MGMGHLVRSFRLAEVLVDVFDVVFLNGGPIPSGISPPVDITLINLPALGMSEQDHLLFSHDTRYSVDEAKSIRQKMVLQAFDHYQPEVILIELFPFGRKKFADELIPLLSNAHQKNPKPLVLSSLRDILVQKRADQHRFENQVSQTLNRYFHAVLLHCDPAFATLSEYFKPTIALQVPVFNTGFVAPPVADPGYSHNPGIIVSAGGGIVGGELYRTAIHAQKLIWKEIAIPMTLVAGPFLPEEEWQHLVRIGHDVGGLTLHRTVSGLMSLLSPRNISVSQCGYNTAMELLQSGVKALVVPFCTAHEDEQMSRAQKLMSAGAVKLLHPALMTDKTLAGAILELRQAEKFQSKPLNTQGALNTLEIILKLRQTGYGGEVQ